MAAKPKFKSIADTAKPKIAEPEWVIDGREFAIALAAAKVDQAEMEQRKLTKKIAQLEAALSEAEKKIAFLRKQMRM